MMIRGAFFVCLMAAASSADSLPRRGGRLQRKRKLEEDDEGGAENHSRQQSELGSFLIHEWSWGFMSAVQCQHTAFKSYLDQCNLLHRVGISTLHADPDLEKMGRFGNYGKSPGNAHRDMVYWLGEPRCVATTCFPVWVKVQNALLSGGGV